VNFAAVAETFGLKSYSVERPSEFAPAFRDALAARRPALIDVRTDQAAVVPLAWGPGVQSFNEYAGKNER